MTHGVPIEGETFLVTGGAGFIGSHLVEALLAHGASEVRVLDVTDFPEDVLPSSADPRVRVTLGDVRDEAVVRGVVDSVAGVFHLATTPLSVCSREPEIGIDVNVTGTMNVIAAARAGGVRKIVFSSASSVYGETDQPTDESFPLAPSNLYGVTKVAGEELLALSAHGGGPAWIALRYMNVYGPRQAGGLIPSVLAGLRAGAAPQIAGDGSAVFDFVHVEDVAAADLAAMQADIGALACNIGSGEAVPVLEIARTLRRLANAAVEPVLEGGPSGPGRRGSIDLATARLGWRPSWTLEHGLADLVGRSA